MLLRRPLSAGASPLLRQLRSQESRTSVVPRPRLFTQNHPLLLFSRHNSPRPQLPYLAQPTRHLPPGPALQRQIARLLTTENRRYVKQQTWLALKWSAVGWSMFFLLSFAWYGWQCELIEREHPSPVEWTFGTRAAFRAGYARMNPEFNGTGVTDWARVGSEFKITLERLEDQAKDGKGLRDVEDVDGGGGPVVIPGVGKAGLDVSDKSYAWKSGYFEVIMNCAKAAEILDDMVLDTTRKLVFQKDVVIGPSNPNPRPVAPNQDVAPLEENCERPFDPPEAYYMRVLTGKGFLTKQRVDAALAYANWLEFRSAHETAEEVYRWAIDIAASATSNPAAVIDRQSGIISELGSLHSTSNILRSSTALATHFARNGEVTTALPIFLSVLRARRAAPIDPDAAVSVVDRKRSRESSNVILSLLGSIIRSSAYPDPGPSGDEIFKRPGLGQPDCAEAELMLYIGEILFATASSSAPSEGLGWTRQAVELAQSGARVSNTADAQQRQQCRDCLQVGVSNWGKMVSKLAKEEKAVKDREGEAAKGWMGWVGGKRSAGSQVRNEWEDEAKTVEALRVKLVRDGIMEQINASMSTPGGVWIG